jgi:mannosyltransferase
MGIASIGRIRPEKGTDLFIEAMLRLLPDLPGAVALVIGRAAREHQKFDLDLKDRVQRAGLIDRIRFVGELPAADLPALMRALSLVMQLPRYEGYGMVPLEAMASGVPFVGTDAGYYRAFSAQGRCGTVVGHQMPAAAALAAQAILTDPTRHTAMSADARLIAENDFSVTTEAAGIAAVYNQLWSTAD